MMTSLKSPAEQIGELSSRIATQAARITELERRLTALEPKPPAPPVKPPAWAGPNSQHTGGSYGGAPSVLQVFKPSKPTYPRQIDGIWRDQGGNAVPDPTKPSPAREAYSTPPDPRHQREIEMLDAQLEQFAPLSGA